MRRSRLQPTHRAAGTALTHIMLGLAMALLVINMVVSYRIHRQQPGVADRNEAFENFQVFTRVVEQVRESYVDGDKVSYQKLIGHAMEGMLESLDPYSQFMNPDAHADMQEETEGKFGGLGIVITMNEDVLTVVSPIEDTPGFRAGLHAGDQILAVDGKPTGGIDQNEAVEMLRGDPGTEVTLRVKSPDMEEARDVVLKREIIRVPSVTDVRLLEEGVGYLGINQFNSPTANDLQAALEKLVARNMRGLIVDLRNNPGGLLHAATQITQKFVPRGELIVFTQGRNRRDRQKYFSQGGDFADNLPLVLLINGGSASASEIMAGALRDHERAILVGEKTFGKGSVQSIIPVTKKGAALRLTTARYYTPSEQVIHGSGIRPHEEVKLTPGQRLAMLEARRAARGKGEPMPIDVQMAKAVDVLKQLIDGSYTPPEPAPVSDEDEEAQTEKKNQPGYQQNFN